MTSGHHMQMRAGEQDCARRIIAFYNAFDEGRYEQMASMFAPQGVWHRAGKALARGGLAGELQERPASQKVCHVVSNVLVELTNTSQAQASFYVTAYRGTAIAGTPTPAVPVLSGPYLLVSVRARMVLQGDHWLFLEKRTTREFEFRN